MLEFLESQRITVQGIMQAILNGAITDLEKASLRDKMGALKILSDIFCGNLAEKKTDDAVTEIIIKPVNASSESNETDD